MARPTVLIVDDDREVTQYLSDIFKGEGWKVLCEQDGDWAIKTFKSRRIDAVILDILIPVLNGFQVADAIRSDARGRDVPIVIMSGIYRGAENRREAIERYGLLEYLNKPVEGDRVRRLLKEAISKRSAAQRKPRADGRRKPIRQTPRPGEVASRRDAATPLPEPKVIPRPGVELKGALADTSIASLLHEIYKLQATGALFLMRGSVKKIVYFDAGHPIFVKSNMLRECLGQMLVSKGRITKEQSDATFEKSRAEKQLHGAVLVRELLLSATELEEILAEQLAYKLWEIFSWPNGEYQFKENAKIPSTPRMLRSSCATIIARGVAQYATEDRLERAAAEVKHRYPAPAGDPFLRFQQVELDSAATPMAEAIDGSRTVESLLGERRWDRSATLRLMQGLYEAGVIDLWDRELKLPPVRSAHRREQLYGLDAQPGLDDPAHEEYLATELVKLKKWDHFRVLGLSRNADTADVEAAFDRLAWRYHPDVYLGSPSELRDLAEGMFNRLRAAYLVLSSPFRREGYLEQLGGASEGDADDEELREAQKHYDEGRAHLEAGRYDKAAWHLRKAQSIDEQSAAYAALLGWAVHKTAPTDHVASKEARRYLELAIQLDPQLDTPHLYLGYLHLAEDELERARESFGKAAQLNPDNREAAEQLEALDH